MAGLCHRATHGSHLHSSVHHTFEDEATHIELMQLRHSLRRCRRMLGEHLTAYCEGDYLHKHLLTSELHTLVISRANLDAVLFMNHTLQRRAGLLARPFSQASLEPWAAHLPLAEVRPPAGTACAACLPSQAATKLTQRAYRTYGARRPPRPPPGTPARQRRRSAACSATAGSCLRRGWQQACRRPAPTSLLSAQACRCW